MARRAGRPAGRDVRLIAIALFAALGLVLRIWCANTARTHDDELHYAEDAMWALSPMGIGDALSFLREHPRDHLRLDPRTGARRPWGRPEAGEIARLGHPCLLQYVDGVVTRAVGAGSPFAAVQIGRWVNAVADALTIPLLPSLATALDGGPAAGLVAAGLYAVYPPAVTYGALDNLDPPLAPLLVLLLLGILRVHRTGTGWLALGVVTGLFVSTKQVGLIAAILVPAILGVLGPRSVRGLAQWTLAVLVVVTVFTDPVAYVQGLLRPSRPIGEMHFSPLAYLAGNLGYVARPSMYYWLSFSRHGEPLAPLMARVHPLLTPAYLVAYAAGALSLDRRRLLVLYLPALLMLTFVLPSDGLWRFHLLAPLVCTGAALMLAHPAPRWRTAVAVAAVLAAAVALLPARPGDGGRLDLGDLLRLNPRAHQAQEFHDPDHPLVVTLLAGIEMQRLLWLPAGSYQVSADVSAPIALALDGRPVLANGVARADVALHGRLHRLSLVFPRGGALRSVSIVRTG